MSEPTGIVNVRSQISFKSFRQAEVNKRGIMITCIWCGRLCVHLANCSRAAKAAAGAGVIRM
jgi:hypothetical protein